MNKDLTIGKPEKVLTEFCIPLFGSIIFQQLYNIADSLVAGKFIGEQALAAVGNSYEITLIFLAFAFGCNIGCSVIVAQFFGAKKYAEMKTSVYTTWVTSLIICIILMCVGIIFGKPLLELIHTPSEIFADSKLYLDIYILGLPFLFFYNIATGIFSALGDSKTPFIFLALSSTANIFVDILFVKSFNMGVSGVAWATFICQSISCILSIYVVVRRLGRIKLAQDERATIFSLEILKKIAGIAIPSILQQSFISVGNIVIQGAINSFGAGVVAGYAAAIKLNNLVITSFTTLGNGVSNYAAQNIGAGKVLRIEQGFKAGCKLVWTICVPIVLIYWLLCRQLVNLFMNQPSAIAINTGIEFLRIVAPFYFVVSLKLIADGILRGLGLMNYFMAATFTDLILRVVLALIFSRTFGTIGIWCAWPIGWGIATIMSVLFYRKGVKGLKVNISEKE